MESSITGTGGVEQREDAVILRVRDLRVHFDVYEGLARAVDGVSFDIRRGELLGLVGESGCGKSVTALSLLRLVPEPPGKVRGSALFHDKNLLEMSNSELRRIRGSRIAMVFQEPHEALNPVFTVGEQMAEVLRAHAPKLKASDLRERVIEALAGVSIPAPEMHLSVYPHELSGGMKQRVMIAMAMLMKPELLIADEPTTALDVTIQGQVLRLLAGLRRDYGVAVLLITHDLGIVAEVCDRVLVMYAGHVVEEASVKALFKSPAHPYTIGLMAARPKLRRPADNLEVIPGRVPPATAFPAGCRFAPRCRWAVDECRVSPPPLKPVPGESRHNAACYRSEQLRAGAPGRES